MFDEDPYTIKALLITNFQWPPVLDLMDLHAGFAAEICDLSLVGVGTFLERPATPAAMRLQTERNLRLKEM